MAQARGPGATGEIALTIYDDRPSGRNGGERERIYDEVTVCYIRLYSSPLCYTHAYLWEVDPFSRFRVLSLGLGFGLEDGFEVCRKLRTGPQRQKIRDAVTMRQEISPRTSCRSSAVSAFGN